MMTSNPRDTRTVFWDNGQVCMIDQRLIPFEFKINHYDDAVQVADAIRTMVVRGAPAIGASAAYGVALTAHVSKAQDVPALQVDLREASDVLAKSRPTAVNLFWAINRMNAKADALIASSADVNAIRAGLLEEANVIADEDIALNQKMGAFGAALVPDEATIIHHCNTGSLATVGWGTALGVIRSANAMGKKIHVLVDETRPRLQGARLTSWELQNEGIAHTIIVDGASGHYLRRTKVDLCVVGADRIAANGDTANKIGTYNLAVVAKANNVPFYVVAPFSTIDLAISHGDMIPIEEREMDEVLRVNGERIAPLDVRAGNPAFDVTPHEFITAIVTERGVIYPPFDVNLRKAAE